MRTPGFLLAVVVSLAGCDKSAEPANPPAPEPEASKPAQPEPAAQPEPEKPATWAEMDRKQRKRFMGLEVLPKMKDLFQEYKADDYGTFQCQTCHGDNWTEIDFKMPNVAYPLPADNPIAAARDYDEEVTAFMVDKVMPTMGDLLGKKYDKATGTGEFGCLSCHVAAE